MLKKKKFKSKIMYKYVQAALPIKHLMKKNKIKLIILV